MRELVKKQTGRDLDDLPAKDLKQLVENAARKVNEAKEAPRAATATGRTPSANIISLATGPSPIRDGPAFHLSEQGGRTMTATTMHTPWGWPQDIEELAEGVWRVSTAGHGGLKLSRERWEELPDVVRDTFLNPTFAEEDCEEPIARTLLGLGDERERELALKIAGYFDRYAPALPFLGNEGGSP